MRVFISWSGSQSHALAKLVHEWLPTVLPFVEPWLSSEDIGKGHRWVADIARRLEESTYCVVCVTPGVAQQPWVNFEAGAISKVVRTSQVSPLLFDVSPAELGDFPLAMFQCTIFQKDDVHKLLRSINEASESPIPPYQVKRGLDYTWDELHGRMGRVTTSAVPRLHINSEIDNGVTDAVLSNTEDEILGLFATRYDEWLYEEEVCDEFDHTKVRIRHYLDHLVKLGLLLEDEYEGNTTYELTAEGRDYVVANELDQ